MITIKTNLSEVMGRQVARLTALQSPDLQQNIMRVVALSLLPIVHDRIHVEGKAADGSQIGTYSPSYLKRRIKFNRGSDPKKIVSLTRQLESDFSAVATPTGYGLGFKNPLNFDKANWVEQQSGKKIYGLTEDERSKVQEVAIAEVHKIFTE